MAIRRPLVVINGTVKELPVGDSLESSESKTQYAIPVLANPDVSGEAHHTYTDNGPVMVLMAEDDV